MSTSPSKLDAAADKLEQRAGQWASEGGVKAKLADELVQDAEFLRKLKPSLMKARAKGELPKNEPPGQTRSAPAGPQLGSRPKPKKNGDGGGGPNPWLVLGGALVAGIFLAKWLDWRGHAHPRT